MVSEAERPQRRGQMAYPAAILQTPASFTFNSPDEWPKWKRRFEQYRVASGLDKEEDERQVSTLLYCLGEEADDVLTSTNITDESRKKFEDVIQKFDEFFKVRKNVIFERARFNQRSQGETETAEQFITSLYSLAADCDFGGLKEQLIRDRIVVGIRDSSLSAKLQMDSELTLEKAKRLVRQQEAVRGQQAILSKQDGETPVNALTSRKPLKRPANSRGLRPPQPLNRGQKCSYCGKGPHPKQSCPAREVVCHKCKKKGHYSSVCRSKAVATVEEPPEDNGFLDTISETKGTTWTAPIKVNGQQIIFKLDTGAEATAVSMKTFKTFTNIQLVPTAKVLCGPNNQRLKVLGQATVQLTYNGRSCQQSIYVIKDLKNNLLGLPAITALQLLIKVDSIQPGNVQQSFPKLFQGLGTLKGDYQIQLKSDAKPYALYTARNVPIPLRGKVKQELERMEKLGVISKVDKPTLWCAGMVVVPKKSGDVRICVDLKPLNESVLRETHPLPGVDETLAQLTGATVMSKLDANSGFWQIPLAKESRELTTFITPFGRYCFNKLPFGISSAPEHFQKRMSTVLDGLVGVLCLMDDILIFGKDQKEHDARLTAALERIQAAGVTLNKDKCEFNKTTLTFLGHTIDGKGISPDPQKTAAINKMASPKSTTELRRFMGMVNQLGKFSPRIAELSKPMRELLSIKRAWNWGPAQEEAFAKVKAELTAHTVLALYDPQADTKVSADASSHGLGAVLLQKQNQEWRPVAYASRSMSETETRYAQIEKEALAITWACEKFSTYILGKHISIETDHKPLVPLLGNKHLDNLPPRVLRFRLRLMRFSYSIEHVPGKFLYAADTLSRAPLRESDAQTLQRQSEVESFINTITSHLPASQQRLQEYQKAQATDPICSRVITYCKSEWPKCCNDSELKPYWTVRGNLTLHDELLLYGGRIVVPKQLQKQTLQKIHTGHQGIVRCRLRAASSVWWPGISKEFEHFIQQCPECVKLTPNPREPLMSTPLPKHPWERIAADLFQLNSATYLLVVDYFSRYPEVIKLNSTTSKAVISSLKSIFSRHGVPSVLMSDNGPQFDSCEMKEFANSYGFQHITSSPHYPQSNGLAERTVKTMKGLLKHTTDPYMALLSYRSTPLPWCNYSPAELLMGRKVKTDIPQTATQLTPQWNFIPDFQQKDKDFKRKQKENYDRHHRVRSTDTLPDNTTVWVRTGNSQTPGRVISNAGTPRSYVVSTPNGLVRRNRQHLNHRLSSANDNAIDTPDDSTTSPTTEPSRDRIMTRTQTGTDIRPPNRLRYD